MDCPFDIGYPERSVFVLFSVVQRHILQVWLQHLETLERVRSGHRSVHRPPWWQALSKQMCHYRIMCEQQTDFPKQTIHRLTLLEKTNHHRPVQV